jgi:hypothetical protein
VAPKELESLQEFAVHHPVEYKTLGLDLAQRNVVQDPILLALVGQEVLPGLILELDIVGEVDNDDIEQLSSKY